MGTSIPIAFDHIVAIILKVLYNQKTYKVTNYTTFTKVTNFRHLSVFGCVIVRK